MYTGLLHTHSGLRYVVLALLVVVVAKSMVGLLSNKPFEKGDGKLTLWLMIATHTQLLVGIILYFLSPFVQFSSATMKDDTLRYWTVEHIFAMVVAVALITAARSNAKKSLPDKSKHRRIFVLTSLAFILIVASVILSGRGLLIPIRP